MKRTNFSHYEPTLVINVDEFIRLAYPSNWYTIPTLLSGINALRIRRTIHLMHGRQTACGIYPARGDAPLTLPGPFLITCKRCRRTKFFKGLSPFKPMYNDS
jgi:hypothetical protein